MSNALMQHIKLNFPIKFNCNTLDELLSPLDSNDKLHDCVLNAIPQLPNGTTIEKIKNSVHPKHFSRNLGISAKVVPKDVRPKIDVYFRKRVNYLTTLYSNKSTIQLYADILKEIPWKAKTDDVSVALTVIEKQDYTDKTHLISDREQENNMKSNQYAESIIDELKKVGNPMPVKN